MSVIKKAINKLLGPLSGPETLRKVYESIQQNKNGIAVDMTDNKDANSQGGAFVDFGWYDEHRFNRGWLRYSEMTVFCYEGQEFAIGIGESDGGYTMNGIDSDLRMMPVPDKKEEKDTLRDRIRQSFREEGLWRSSVFVAEEAQMSGKGRIYHKPVDHFDSGYPCRDPQFQGRWPQLLAPETIEKRLPGLYTAQLSVKYNDSKVLIEPVGRPEQETAKYDRAIVPALALVIDDLLASPKSK